MALLLVRNLLRYFAGGEQYRLAELSDFKDGGGERVIYGLAVYHYHLGGEKVPIASLLKVEHFNADDFLSITSHGEQMTVVRQIRDERKHQGKGSGRQYHIRLIRNAQERVSRVYESVELCKPFPANDDGVITVLHLVKRSHLERAVSALASACDTEHGS